MCSTNINHRSAETNERILKVTTDKSEKREPQENHPHPQDRHFGLGHEREIELEIQIHKEIKENRQTKPEGQNLLQTTCTTLRIDWKMRNKRKFP